MFGIAFKKIIGGSVTIIRWSEKSYLKLILKRAMMIGKYQMDLKAIIFFASIFYKKNSFYKVAVRDSM